MMHENYSAELGVEVQLAKKSLKLKNEVCNVGDPGGNSENLLQDLHEKDVNKDNVNGLLCLSNACEVFGNTYNVKLETNETNEVLKQNQERNVEDVSEPEQGGDVDKVDEQESTTTSEEHHGSLRTKQKTSCYRGVSKCSKDGRWQARIRTGKIVRYLGRYKTQEEAARAYDLGAIKYHGIKAVLNFNRNEYKTQMNAFEMMNLPVNYACNYPLGFYPPSPQFTPMDNLMVGAGVKRRLSLPDYVPGKLARFSNGDDYFNLMSSARAHLEQLVPPPSFNFTLPPNPNLMMMLPQYLNLKQFYN